MGYQVITTVVTPAAGYLLSDLQTVKQELDIPSSDTSKDPWLNTKLANVSASIARHCNRVFPAETVQDIAYLQQDAYPWQVPGGVQPLQLTRWPIQSVTSVNVADPSVGTLTAGTDFAIDAENGQLIRLSSFTKYPIIWEAAPTTVIYVGGFTAIPGDVVEACLKMITKAFWQRGTNPTLKARHQTQTGFSEEYWISDKPEGNMTPDIQDLLEPYRVPVTA